MCGRRANSARRKSANRSAFRSRFASARTRKGDRRFFDLARGQRLALNRHYLVVDLLDLREQGIFALGKFDQFSKGRARNIRGHPPTLRDRIRIATV